MKRPSKHNEPIINLERLAVLAQRLILNREIFFTTQSPRATVFEYECLRNLGYYIQMERPIHEPTQMYAMRGNGLDEQNKKLLSKMGWDE